MPNAKFDAKSFNPEAFKYAVDRVPRVRLNEMRKSKVLAGNPDISAVFSSQNGTGYARIAMRGLLDGNVQNYDGQTDMVASSTKTFEQGVVVISRMKSWVERDFSFDITGGVDFMDNVAAQVSAYYEDVDQEVMLAILKGVFSMTSAKGAEFVDKHTYTVDGNMEATTLNSATAKACGDHKKKFAMIFMHSVPATNLENLNLLTNLKYTDKDGITRDLAMYSWNGKLVVVDDDMPAETGEDGTVTYTSYVLGEGSIAFEDLGVKVPYEMDRDPAKNGGQDTLYTRQRKVFAPYGISYEKVNQASLSPEKEELADGANWDVVHSGETAEADRSYIADKAIPLCRILSKG